MVISWLLLRSFPLLPYHLVFDVAFDLACVYIENLPLRLVFVVAVKTDRGSLKARRKLQFRVEVQLLISIDDSSVKVRIGTSLQFR